MSILYATQSLRAAGVSFIFYPTNIRVVSIFFSVRKPMHVFPEKSVYTLNTNRMITNPYVCMYVGEVTWRLRCQRGAHVLPPCYQWLHKHRKVSDPRDVWGVQTCCKAKNLQFDFKAVPLLWYVVGWVGGGWQGYRQFCWIMIPEWSCKEHVCMCTLMCPNQCVKDWKMRINGLWYVILNASLNICPPEDIGLNIKMCSLGLKHVELLRHWI